MQVRLHLACTVLASKTSSGINALIITDRGGWSAQEGTRGSVHRTAGT